MKYLNVLAFILLLSYGLANEELDGQWSVRSVVDSVDKSNITSDYPNPNDGGKSPTVIGGYLASAKTGAHVVKIYIVSSRGVSTCTGSIITSNVILSAAHCFVDSRIRQVVVTIGTNSNSRAYLSAAGVYMYSRYKNRNFDYDAALVVLSRRLKNYRFFYFYRSSGYYPPANSYVYSAGHGRTTPSGSPSKKLQELKSIVVAKSRCSARSLCLIDRRYPNGKTGVCKGDSGGPTFLKLRNGRYVLIGITSSGAVLPNGNCRLKNGFSRSFTVASIIGDIFNIRKAIRARRWRLVFRAN